MAATARKTTAIFSKVSKLTPTKRDCRESTRQVSIYIVIGTPRIHSYKRCAYVNRKPCQERAYGVGHEHHGALPRKHHLPAGFPQTNIASFRSRNCHNLCQHQGLIAPNVCLDRLDILRGVGSPEQIKHCYLLRRDQKP